VSQQIMKVDLTLAVNYLPACICLCKALVLTLAMALIPPGEEMRGGYIPLAALLYMDRMLMRNMIFDANAILMAIYFANVHAAVRASSLRQTYQIFMWGLHVCWVGMCLTLLTNPSRVRWLFEKKAQASKVVPVALMLLILVCTSFVNSPLETGVIRACRALAFTMLSFAWIYMVGIHSQQGIEYLKETSCQFVARLAPVLYSPLWLAVVFSPAAVTALIWQYTHHIQTLDHPTDLQAVVTESQQKSSESTEEAQLQELLQQAKLGRLQAIPE
jgi:hypothetical protein